MQTAKAFFPFACSDVPCQKLNRRETFMIYQFSFDSIGFCLACLFESVLLFTRLSVRAITISSSLFFFL
jgi:hypothetical protein